jgi:hypothetical protein
MGRDSDNVGPGRSATPDGVLDHHIKVSGLASGGNRLIVKSASGAFTYSNEAEIPLAMMRPVLPGSPTGLADIWFNPASGNETITDWVVHVRYADGSEDHIPTTLPDAGNAQAAKLRTAMERAKAELDAGLAP